MQNWTQNALELERNYNVSAFLVPQPGPFTVHGGFYLICIDVTIKTAPFEQNHKVLYSKHPD